MEFFQPVTDLIKKRTSWRSYLNRPLDETIKEKLYESLASLNVGPFGTQLRFQLLEVDQAEAEEKKKLGTYGVISGCRSFITGACRSSDSCRCTIVESTNGS